MYDFLGKNIKYEDLNDSEKLKADFLEKYTNYTEKTKKSYWSVYKSTITEYEKLLNKGLEFFNRDELINLIKYMPSKRLSVKNTTVSFIHRFREHCETIGLNTNNVVETIKWNEIKTLNNNIVRSDYSKLDDFYNFLENTKDKISPVDKITLLLFRHGLTIQEVLNLKYTDIYNLAIHIKRCRNVEILIDNRFMDYLEESKNCTLFKYGSVDNKKRMINYKNSQYIVKANANRGAEKITANGLYTRLNIISKALDTKRLSVNVMRLNYKLEYLFNVLKTNGTLTNEDIKQFLIKNGEMDNNNHIDNKVFSLKELFLSNFSHEVIKVDNKNIVTKDKVVQVG